MEYKRNGASLKMSWLEIESEIRGQSNFSWERMFYFLTGELVAGSEFMVIERCKKIGRTSGPILKASRSLSALNRATYSVSISLIESSSWLVGDRRLLRAS